MLDLNKFSRNCMNCSISSAQNIVENIHTLQWTMKIIKHEKIDIFYVLFVCMLRINRLYFMEYVEAHFAMQKYWISNCKNYLPFPNGWVRVREFMFDFEISSKIQFSSLALVLSSYACKPLIYPLFLCWKIQFFPFSAAHGCEVEIQFFEDFSFSILNSFITNIYELWFFLHISKSSKYNCMAKSHLVDIVIGKISAYSGWYRMKSLWISSIFWIIICAFISKFM